MLSYSGKLWWVESLANLENHLRFAKLKLVASMNIDNPLTDLFICQTFSSKCLKRINSPNNIPTKLSHYTVCLITENLITFLIVMLYTLKNTIAGS